MPIVATEYKKRRNQLMRMMGDRAIAIVPGAREKIRNRDTHYPFRQDSDFHYLTGFPEADAVAVFVPGRKAAEFILFCRDRDPAMETWNGRRAGPEGACDIYAADDAFPIDDIDEILPGLMEGRERVLYTMGSEPEFDHRVINWVHRLRAEVAADAHTPQEFITLDHFLHDLRLYKSPAEITRRGRRPHRPPCAERGAQPKAGRAPGRGPTRHRPRCRRVLDPPRPAPGFDGGPRAGVRRDGQPS